MLALTNGLVECFPGEAVGKSPRLAAVHGWDEARRAGDDGGGLVMLVRVHSLETPPADVRARCVEVVEARNESAFQAAAEWIARKRPTIREGPG